MSIGVVVLRRREPGLARPFRVAFSPVVPLAAAAVSVALMAGRPWATWQRLFAWMGLGLAIAAVRRWRWSRGLS